MRVLTVTPSFPPDYTGGAEVSIYHTVRGLIDRGVQGSILSVKMRHPVRADDWYDLDGIHVHRVRFPTHQLGGEIIDRRVYGAVRREIDALRPDIVHIHNTSGSSLAPFVAARRAGVPVVNTLHDLWLLCPNNMLLQKSGAICDPAEHPHGCGQCSREYEYWGAVPRRRQLFARITDNALFISPSQGLIDRHVRGGYDPDRFRLIPYGFEETPISPATHPGVHRLQNTWPRPPLVVFGGGGVVVKGSRVVLGAARILHARAPHVRIAIAGNMHSSLATEYHRDAPNVLLLGKVPFTNMRTLFSIADLTLMSSIIPENLPVTIYESHQVGTPVVGSDIGGIPELIDHGQTGYIVPPGDSEAMAQAIMDHFARPALEQRRMRMACVKAVRTERSLDRFLDSLLEVYAEVRQGAAERSA